MKKKNAHVYTLTFKHRMTLRSSNNLKTPLSPRGHYLAPFQNFINLSSRTHCEHKQRQRSFLKY